MGVGLSFERSLREEQRGSRRPLAYLTHHKRNHSQPLVLRHELFPDPLAKRRRVPAVSWETSVWDTSRGDVKRDEE